MKATEAEYTMLEKIQLEGRGLTDWERSFITSVDDQLHNSGFLSERQREILERIYTEKTP